MGVIFCEFQMCDSRCTGARPGSPCHCDCRGANHGRGYRHAGYAGTYPRHPTYTPVTDVPIPAPQEEQSIGAYFESVGKAALTSALIYGLSAAVPPFGAVAIPLYTAYNYSKMAHNIYRFYEENRSKGSASSGSTMRAAGSIGELGSQPAADAVAKELSAKAQQSGLFNDMARQTNVESIVFAEMIRGSTSSALSSSSGELAKFMIAKAIGA